MGLPSGSTTCPWNMTCSIGPVTDFAPGSAAITLVRPSRDGASRMTGSGRSRGSPRLPRASSSGDNMARPASPRRGGGRFVSVIAWDVPKARLPGRMGRSARFVRAPSRAGSRRTGFGRRSRPPRRRALLIEPALASEEPEERVAVEEQEQYSEEREETEVAVPDVGGFVNQGDPYTLVRLRRRERFGQEDRRAK